MSLFIRTFTKQKYFIHFVFQFISSKEIKDSYENANILSTAHKFLLKANLSHSLISCFWPPRNISGQIDCFYEGNFKTNKQAGGVTFDQNSAVCTQVLAVAGVKSSPDSPVTLIRPTVIKINTRVDSLCVVKIKQLQNPHITSINVDNLCVTIFTWKRDTIPAGDGFCARRLCNARFMFHFVHVYEKESIRRKCIFGI